MKSLIDSIKRKDSEELAKAKERKEQYAEFCYGMSLVPDEFSDHEYDYNTYEIRNQGSFLTIKDFEEFLKKWFGLPLKARNQKLLMPGEEYEGMDHPGMTEEDIRNSCTWYGFTYETVVKYSKESDLPIEEAFQRCFLPPVEIWTIAEYVHFVNQLGGFASLMESGIREANRIQGRPVNLGLAEYKKVVEKELPKHIDLMSHQSLYGITKDDGNTVEIARVRPWNDRKHVTLDFLEANKH